MEDKWTVMACENCLTHFAIKEEANFQSCPSCGSEDTTGTGEYLSGQLYTKSGKPIKG